MEHQQFGFYHRARLPAGELLPMDDLIAGWIELPRVAAWIPQKGGDIEARVVRAKEAGAGLLWVEGEKPVSSDSGWTGSFARSEAEVSLAAANRADFSFIRKGVTGLGEEHEIPVYLPAESASEAAAAEEAGAQGVWLEF